MSSFEQYTQEHQERFLNELFDFLRIPSISTLSTHQQDIQDAAAFVQDQLQKAGADKAYLIPTQGSPLVYAEKIMDPSLPTVLVYGHYDVQPADPLDAWETPPFEPHIRDGKIYARGASDDKGQVYMHVKVLEAMIATQTLPCNLKFIIEGEEEIGSTHIQQFLAQQEHQALLAADVVVVSDTTVYGMDQPSIDISLRGVAAFEVKLQGPRKDLHSGVYGGAVANPAEMLCRILAQLKDDEGRVRIPGFYDDVATCSPAERDIINQQPFDLAQYQADLGVKGLFSEQGYTIPECLGIRPCIEVNGISSGYTEEGIKAVIPSQAIAKLTIRSVPHQNGDTLGQQLAEYLQSIAPPSVHISVQPIGGGGGHKPFKADLQGQGLQAASQAFAQVWGKRPFYTYQGASIPILSTFQNLLKTDVVNLGFGLESDSIHSPNEHFGLANFEKGIKTIAAFYQAFARTKSS